MFENPLRTLLPPRNTTRRRTLRIVSIACGRNLWGVGSTAPYLHDGRATTLTEAILEHGGEALQARNAFTSLATSKQKDLIAFLDNLVLYKLPEE